MEKRKTIHKIEVAVLLTIAVLVLIPYVWMIMTSFKTSKDYLMHSSSLWPRAWTLEGYKKVFTGSPFFKWFLNSLLVTGSITAIVIFTSTMAGFVFAKYNFWHKEVWCDSGNYDGAVTGYHDSQFPDRAESGSV